MPATEQLATIEKMNLVLGAAAVAGGGLLWGARGMLAAGVGAALSAANFWALRRLGARAVARVEAGATTGQALLLVASLAGKMMLLFALVWVAVRRIGLPVLPFTLGLSAFVASALVGGLYLGPRGLKVRPATGASGDDSSRTSTPSSSSNAIHDLPSHNH
ncbi:MAG TPA: ATP synthase subunit I [Polyangia bacterium]